MDIKHCLMLNRDALSIYFLCINILCCQLLVCIDVWPNTSMQGSKLNFSKNYLLGTFNDKMVAMKQQTKKTHIEGRIFHVVLHELFGDTIARLSFANLECSLPC